MTTTSLQIPEPKELACGYTCLQVRKITHEASAETAYTRQFTRGSLDKTKHNRWNPGMVCPSEFTWDGLDRTVYKDHRWEKGY